MKVLLDTNFIVTCAKKSLDFNEKAHEIIDENIEWIVPQQVLNELGNIKNRKESKKKDKDAALLSFDILKTLKPKVVDIGKHQNVDIAIINYILDTDIVLATLDKELKNRIQHNKILTIKGKNHLKIL